MTSTLQTVPRPGPVTAPPAPSPGSGSQVRAERNLKKALRIAWVLLGAQLVGMCTLSWVVYHRWSNTWDYAIRYQGWWGIAHGNLDPYSSVVSRFFFQDHFEVINWPLAPISLLWPHGVWPLWIQDLMVTGAEVGAVLMVTDALRRGDWSRRIPGWVAVGLVTLMLVANPWIYDSIAFDFHYQSVGAACFALLACRELILGRSRWRLIAFSALCLACGDIAGTYLAAVGVGGVLAGRETRKRGALLVAAGLFWFGLVRLADANQGSSLAGHYGYLAGVSFGAAFGVGAMFKALLSHPDRALDQLWIHRVDLWAYVSSAGVLGLFSPWATVPILVLLETGLASGTGLSGTAYQNFGAVIFLIPLSVLVLGRLDAKTQHWWSTRAQRRRPLVRSARRPGTGRLTTVFGGALVGLLAVAAIGWGLTWIPQVPTQWLRTSRAAAATLDAAEKMIPANAEVVASQGITGRLADRQWLYRFIGTGAIPLHTKDVYFVIVPNAGIELSSVQSAEGAIGQLTGPLHGQLLLNKNGVWLIRLRRPPALNTLLLPSVYSTLPAWVGRSATGVRVLDGPASDWHMAQGSHRAGYVLYGTQWNELPGDYQVTVTIANTAPVNLEVWDSSANTLLSRQELVPATGFQTIQTTIAVTRERANQPFGGLGPFQFAPVAPPPGDRIEVRVWSNGRGITSVYSVELQPAR